MNGNFDGMTESNGSAGATPPLQSPPDWPSTTMIGGKYPMRRFVGAGGAGFRDFCFLVIITCRIEERLLVVFEYEKRLIVILGVKCFHSASCRFIVCAQTDSFRKITPASKMRSMCADIGPQAFAPKKDNTNAPIFVGRLFMFSFPAIFYFTLPPLGRDCLGSFEVPRHSFIALLLSLWGD